MTWGPPKDYGVSGTLKNCGLMVNLSPQKSIFMRGGVLDFSEGFLRVTKDCYRRIWY